MSNNASRQYLTFVLGEEVFALPIGKVREVLELTSVSQLPRTPDYMKGVINIRGHAIPVVDMRRKLGVEETAPTVNTCIVILDVAFDNGISTLGAIVDSVREVVEIDKGAIEPAPSLGHALDASYIEGLGTQGDQFLILLDVDAVFAGEEMPAHQGEAALAA